jgi:hypothetical protein
MAVTFPTYLEPKKRHKFPYGSYADPRSRTN